MTGFAARAATTGPETLLAALRDGTARLEARGVETPRQDAEHLLAHVLDTDRLRLYLDFERPLSAGEAAAFDRALARRAAREPLQHVLGRQPFRHLDLAVGPGALIPRPETEELAGAALEALARLMSDPSVPARVLDLGTGSGCIALALAAERPGTSVVAVDASRAALAVARGNARRLGLAVDFREGDLYGALEAGERFDLIVANPPYLTPAEWRAAPPEVRDHEPREALVGGEDGLELHRRILAGAVPWLAPGAGVLLEIGASQGAAVTALARAAGFTAGVRKDLAGRDRIVIAVRDGGT